MNSDKWLNDALQNLRRAKGLCPLTREQADAELKKAKRIPMSNEEIRSLASRIASGRLEQEEEETIEKPWGDYEVDEELAGEILQLNRNAGEDDPETAQKLEDLREELLRDGDDEDATTE